MPVHLTPPGPTPPFTPAPVINPFSFDIADIIREFAVRGAAGLFNRSPLGDGGFGGDAGFDNLNFNLPPVQSSGFSSPTGLGGLDLGFLFGEAGGGTLSNTLLALQLLQGLQGSQQGGELFSGISIGER